MENIIIIAFLFKKKSAYYAVGIVLDVMDLFFFNFILTLLGSKVFIAPILQMRKLWLRDIEQSV